MKIAVLGAGVVGVTSAWYLARAGHEVTVIERQPAAGLETSFANGGQISVSHAEPWANPHVLGRALRWLGREDAPLLIRLRADPALFSWLARFLMHCPPWMTRRNIAAIVRLALHSRSCLQALRAETGMHYDQLRRGILHFYTDPHEFAAAGHAAALMRAHGCDRQTIDADACIAIEPALASIRPQLVGGDFTAADESGDAHRFTQQLAALAAAQGVVFCYDTTVRTLIPDAGHVRVELDGDKTLDCERCVVAMGSFTPLLLRRLGVSLPIYPAKGYSATFTLGADSVAPTVSLTDDAHKIVISRLGERLRVAGTAEFAGYDLSLNPTRSSALVARAHALFPDLHPVGAPALWSGLRPATPSNVPIIGPTRLPGVWVNSGHGTLGWTMSCGSGERLARAITSEKQQAVTVS